MTPEIWESLAAIAIGAAIGVAGAHRREKRRLAAQIKLKLKFERDEYEKFWQEQHRAQGDENDT